jgi:GDP-L-fucose synthase
MNKNSNILIVGMGMVGLSICDELLKNDYINVSIVGHNVLDCTSKRDVMKLFLDVQPEYVFICAARVGGIKSNNTYPVEYFQDNMLIAMNIINASYLTNVKKLMMLGSSCIYPKDCPQPIKEEYLLKNFLEPTNEMYALAKISAIKLCQSYNREYNTNYISVMPCSLYGGFESYDLENSHFMPALMSKMHSAKVKGDDKVYIWGSGKPQREMMHVQDFANAAIFLMDEYDETDIINVGTGVDHSINMIANHIKKAVGYKGELVYQLDKPDGVYRKILDSTRINNLGWKSTIDIVKGVEMMYNWAIKHDRLFKAV